jgi:N-acetylmuramoyl-L-alanine amidase
MRLLKILLLLTTFLNAVAAAAADVIGIRAWPAPDHTRVVFDVSGPLEHTIFRLDNPQRLVVDMRGTRLLRGLSGQPQADALIKRMRFGRRNDNDLRVVMDLHGAVSPKSFLLSPSGNYGYRLVVDVRKHATASAVSIQRKKAKALRKIVIAIDAGHGGDDPGAIGAAGTREKVVTLAVARKLQKRINKLSGFKSVLIRSGDYYVGLRERITRARRASADLMVSIHADAFKDRRVRGSSVWVLSTRGATSEAARWLAARENAADLAGGVSLDDKDDLLASVLLDLSQTATLNESRDIADVTLSELRRVGRVHKPHVERAGFVVLKAPDIPSILVETAFISNPHEERKLRQPAHQAVLADALARGIQRYFQKRPPPGTLLAGNRHVISPGETLSQIALRYDVPVETLKQSNRLQGNIVRSGQVLRIPRGS